MKNGNKAKMETRGSRNNNFERNYKKLILRKLLGTITKSMERNVSKHISNVWNHGNAV